MTREEALKYLINPVATSTKIGEEKQKEFEAYNMAIEALKEPKGEWSKHPRSQLYVCSVCGKQELRTTGFCPNCGAKMDKGGDTK